MRLPVRFDQLYLLALLVCLTHSALDWLNSHGIRMLEPLSSTWFYGDALFIVDLWLWLGLSYATWRSVRLERHDQCFQRTARVALTVALAYMGFNVAVSGLHHAMNTDAGSVIPNPVPFVFWERQKIFGDGDGHWWIAGRHVGEVPLSRCDLTAARRSNADADAFLSWSCAPFVRRSPMARHEGSARTAR